MAKDNDVEITAMKARIAELEQALLKATAPKAIVLDSEYEEFKRWTALSPFERTQANADKRWGQDPGQRYRVGLERDKTGIGEKFELLTSDPVVEIVAHSPEEAQARYDMLCGCKILVPSEVRHRVELAA